MDISERYDHKHQELSSRDVSKGLNKMAVDIVKSLFLTLAGIGVKLDRGIFDTLLSAYVRKAEDTMRFYAADAEINGLKYDRHEEELAVATFVRSIRTAGRDYLSDPLGNPMIPNWNRVDSALPISSRRSTTPSNWITDNLKGSRSENTRRPARASL